ncbi:hypothetical protein ACQ4PT_048155 [Festuca glaucescens]
MGVGSVGLSSIDGMIQGVNYASAAAGILSSSGSEMGMHVSLTQQVQQVEDTYEQLALALGEAAIVDLFKRSVFFVSIGSNDFIHYYLRDVSGVQMHYLPWEFNQLLVNSVRQEIKSHQDTGVQLLYFLHDPLSTKYLSHMSYYNFIFSQLCQMGLYFEAGGKRRLMIPRILAYASEPLGCFSVSAIVTYLSRHTRTLCDLIIRKVSGF